jgi:hypothetical protein
LEFLRAGTRVAFEETLNNAGSRLAAFLRKIKKQLRKLNQKRAEVFSFISKKLISLA